MTNTTATATATAAKIAELKALFATDPSDALYRAEEELLHTDFLDFVEWASEPALDELCWAHGCTLAAGHAGDHGHTEPEPIWTPATPDERRHAGVSELVAETMACPEGHRYARAFGILAGLVASDVSGMNSWAREYADRLQAAMTAPFVRTNRKIES